MNIGEIIRCFRLQKKLSQGDIENRTGLLCSYLSRVENGHTIPSLGTLAKLATAMDVPLARFLADGFSSEDEQSLPLPTEGEIHFLTQIRRYSPHLSSSDRKLVLHIVKKMAAKAT